jgi:putative FmdB family regulatory protein
MPTYDFTCLQCKKPFDVFMTYAEYGSKDITCPNCESKRVMRRIGRIRVAKSEESRLENLIDPANLSGIEDDPKALGRLMRQMGSELGEDVGPEFDEVVSRLEKGQDPEQIEREVPRLVDNLPDVDD